MTEALYTLEPVQDFAKQVRNAFPQLEGNLDDVDDLIGQLSVLPDRTFIDRATLHKIAEEKSTRRAELVYANGEDHVRQITKLAFSIDHSSKPISLLCTLDGIDVPTASAVLSWMFPDKWPVIDRRAWKVLYHSGIVNTHKDGIMLRRPQWEFYLRVVEELRRELSEYDFTPQRIDRVLYLLADPKYGIVPKDS